MSTTRRTLAQDLECPITHDVFEDPVTVPCCGRAFSRDALLQALCSRQVCPLCSTQLLLTTVQALPPNRLIKDLVDAHVHASGAEDVSNPEEEAKLPSPSWQVSSTVLHRHPADGTKPVVKTIVRCTDAGASASHACHLCLLVLDKSGSMGSAMRQVQEATRLLAGMAHGARHVLLRAVQYDQRWREITNPQSCVLEAGGGTSFMEAFNGIQAVFQREKDRVTGASVVFLTDGESTDRVVDPVSGASVPATTAQLMTHVSSVLSAWGHPVTVHCVGFTANHKLEFLEALRSVGHTPGMYQYANPNENSDSLYQKLSAIVTPILQGGVRLHADVEWLPGGARQRLELAGGQAVIWTTGATPPTQARIQSSSSDTATLVDISVNRVADPDLWTEYYSVATDKIIEDMLDLQRQQSERKLDADDAQLFALVLQRRAQAILSLLQRLSPDGSELHVDPAPVMQRVQQALQAISLILSGSGAQVSRASMLDLQFQSRVAPPPPPRATPAPPPLPVETKTDNGNPYAVRTSIPAGFNIYPRGGVARMRQVGGDGLFQTMINGSNSSIVAQIAAEPPLVHNTNGNGHTPLMLAAAMGRVAVVDALLAAGADLAAKDKHGHSALFYAATNGFWVTYGKLRAAGAQWTDEDVQAVLHTCVFMGYTRTADLLIADSTAHVTRQLQALATNARVRAWLLSTGDMGFEDRLQYIVQNGLDSSLDPILSKITPGQVTFREYAKLFGSKSCAPGHLSIVHKLLSSGKLNVNETWTEVDGSRTSALMSVISNSAMVGVLLDFAPDIDLKAGTNGTTALWLACLHGYQDTALMLLQAGADVNALSTEGDPPLIPACRMGHTSVVKLLLQVGADAGLHNPDRDNAVLVCCRHGHAQALDLVLAATARSHPQFLTDYAQVDGFGPVISAAEMDRAECIRVLARHGADLEQRSAPCSGSIVGATAAHVAARFGKVNALRALLELRVDVNARTIPGGATPLHLAVQYGHAEVVRLLFSIPSVDKTIVDDEGHTAEYFAKSNERRAIFQEFFFCALRLPLISLFARDPTKALNILRSYGQTPGCCEWNQVLNVDCGYGSGLLSVAVLRRDATMLAALQGMGLRMDAPDFRGLTPEFWQVLTSGTESTNEHVMRVRRAAASVQSRLLLDISPPASFDPNAYQSIQDMGAPASPTFSSEWTIPAVSRVQLLIAGSDAFWERSAPGMRLLLNDDQWQQVTQAVGRRRDYPLLGFLTKLASGVSGLTPQQLEQLVWEAKLHTIATLATVPDCPLSLSHMISIFLFAWLPQVQAGTNAILRDWQPANAWSTYACCLYQALTLLPPLDAECYVATSGPLACDIGSMVTLDSFCIVYGHWSQVWQESATNRVAFIVRTRFGARAISQYARAAQNHEVVILPGTRFIVRALYKYNVVVFGQPNIRAFSFTAEESDIAKAREGRRSIVVELEEVVPDA